MVDNCFDEITNEVSRYALTTNLLNEFLEDLKTKIRLKQDDIIASNNEDVKNYRKQIKINELFKIIDKYKNSECILEDDERKIVFYKGSPYLTLHICLQALIRRNRVFMIREDFMPEVNLILLKIFNETLEEYNIFNLIQARVGYDKKDIIKRSKYYDEIIVIGIEKVFKEFTGVIKMKFFPYYNVALYCDTEILKKLEEAIEYYCQVNNYELKIYSKESAKKAVLEINNNKFLNSVILLTQNVDHKEIFENEIKNKPLYINENPFKREVGKIYDYFKKY